MQDDVDHELEHTQKEYVSVKEENLSLASENRRLKDKLDMTEHKATTLERQLKDVMEMADGKVSLAYNANLSLRPGDNVDDARRQSTGASAGSVDVDGVGELEDFQGGPPGTGATSKTGTSKGSTAVGFKSYKYKDTETTYLKKRESV